MESSIRAFNTNDGCLLRTRGGVPLATQMESVIGPIDQPVRRSGARKFWRHLLRHPMGLASLIVISFVILLAILAPIVAPYNPYTPSSQSFAAPSVQHLFGTDMFGRDILSRVIYGARISLAVGFVSVVVGGVLGAAMGMLASIYRGVIEQMIMRFVDVLLSFPFILLALLILAFFGSGVVNVMIAIGVARIPNFARLAHASSISMRDRDFVEAARANGAKTGRIVVRHILPNIMQQLVVYATFSIPLAMLIEAGLDYLGLGVNPSTPTWGQIINQGQQSLLTAPWEVIAPGVAIVITVLAFNIFGETVSDYLDPKSGLGIRV